MMNWIMERSYWKVTFPSAGFQNLLGSTHKDGADGVSLVVEDVLDEVVSIVVNDAVGVVAELKASYLVVGDVNTCAIGSDLDSEDRGGQSPGSIMSATPISIVMTHVLVVVLIVSICRLLIQTKGHT
jgi:hypothetical protein